LRLAALATLLVSLTGLACCRPDEPARKTPTGPNVLLLVMDTARADRWALNGCARPTTPRLEALARESVNYRNAWSPCGWTPPAHASLFTGLLPIHHGLDMSTRDHLPDEARTLAEILRDAGYRTACYSDNALVSPSLGLVQGFEDFVPVFTRGPPRESRCHATHREALEWATGMQRRGERFFLFINDIEPHAPYSPPEPFQRRLLRGSPSPEAIAEAVRFHALWELKYCAGQIEMDDAKRALLSDLYDGEIATVDDAVGELVEGLRTAGLLDDTLVIVTSDHGEALGEHHRFGHNLGLDGWLLRIPLLVRWPGGRDGGTTVDDLVRLEDLMPTILEACGIPVPAGLDAVGLRHDLPGRTSTAQRGRPWGPLTAQVIRESGATWLDVSLRTATDGRYLLIRSSDGRDELYDVIADPREETDLAASHPDVVRRLAALPGME
jgi:arylsulfatase A-like enzyme